MQPLFLLLLLRLLRLLRLLPFLEWILGCAAGSAMCVDLAAEPLLTLDFLHVVESEVEAVSVAGPWTWVHEVVQPALVAGPWTWVHEVLQPPRWWHHLVR